MRNCAVSHAHSVDAADAATVNMYSYRPLAALDATPTSTSTPDASTRNGVLHARQDLRRRRTRGRRVENRLHRAELPRSIARADSRSRSSPEGRSVDAASAPIFGVTTCPGVAGVRNVIVSAFNRSED